MRFQCPFCSYVMSVEDSFRGYRVNCPSCAKSVLVPVGRFDVGSAIGDFLIRAKIGEGSIGAVYRATQISLDRVVALKILSPEYTNAKGLADFLREARAAAKLNHPNIVQSLAVGEEDGTCYMAMTYINGETLKARLKREGPTPVDESLHIVQQVAEALFYAWDEVGIIHRDVKPDNIMITEDGIIKLTDLGLAMNQAEWREGMEISGSPSYMSPEQFTGEKLDSRSDIYSLGVTLYQMLSGSLPFDAQTVKSVARQHFEQEPQPLNKLNPRIPLKVAQLVNKMMAKCPDDRFNDMENLLKAIWTIRQRTAPDRSLVPDVHTISIKRLDYEIQRESLDEKKAAKKAASAVKKRPPDVFRVAVIAIPAILIIGLLVALLFGQKSANEDKMAERVAYFSRLIADKNINLDTSEREGLQILSEFGVPKTPRQEAICSQLRQHLAEIARRKAEKDAVALKDSLKETQAQLAALKAALDGTKSRLEQVSMQNVSSNGDKSSLKADLDSAQAELARIKREMQAIKDENKKISQNASAKSNNLWMTPIRASLLSFSMQGRLKEAEAMLSVKSEKRPASKKWFDAKSAELDRLSQIFNAISNSATKYTGVFFDSDSRIVMISDGIIDYQDSSSRIKQKPWSELSPEAVIAILSKDPKITYPDADVRASLEVLKGNLGAALKLMPKDKELAESVEAFVAQSVDSIKYTAATDRKKADAKALSLFKQLEGSDEQLGKAKDALKDTLQIP